MVLIKPVLGQLYVINGSRPDWATNRIVGKCISHDSKMKTNGFEYIAGDSLHITYCDTFAKIEIPNARDVFQYYVQRNLFWY